MHIGIPVGVTCLNQVLRRAGLLIWDEASMSPKEAVDGADALLRDLTGDGRWFGGKVVLFAGDFRQVLPVMPHASRDEIVAHSLRFHTLWRENLVNEFSLKGNARALADEAYAKYLLTVGDGAASVHAEVTPCVIELPPQICAPQHWGKKELIDHVFPDLLAAVHRCAAAVCTGADMEYFEHRALLSEKCCGARREWCHSGGVVAEWMP